MLKCFRFTKTALISILALTIIFSLGITTYAQESAAPVDLNRAAVYTFAEGNIARDPRVQQCSSVTDPPTAYNPTTGAGVDRPGINVSYYSTYGTPVNQAVQRINGIRPSAGTANGYLSWAAPAGANNYIYFILNWPEPQKIDAVRCEWWNDNNVTPPTGTARVEWLDGVTWKEVTNMRNPAGTAVTNIGSVVMGTWNGVTFDPITTSQLRLKLQRSSTNNQLGVGEWEVFGTKVDTFISVSALASFGSVTGTPYTQPAAQTVTITNTSSDAITLNQPTANNYIIGALSTTTLAATGATATFTVQPKVGLAIGVYNELITISGSGGASASVGASFTVMEIPKGFDITVIGGTADKTDAFANEIVTLTLDESAIPAGKRFMQWSFNRVPANATAPIQPVGFPTYATKKLSVTMPAGNLIATALYDVIPFTAEEINLDQTERNLVTKFSQRLRGTPNENNAAAWVLEQFKSYGYTDAVRSTIPYYNNGTGPTTGLVRFSNNVSDILGAANPASTAVAAANGPLIDLGTYVSANANLNLSALAGVSGNIVAAVRLDPASTAAILNGIKTYVEAQYPAVRVTGILHARSGGTLANKFANSGAQALTSNLPNIGIPIYFFEVAMGNKANFSGFAWHPASTTTNSIAAIKPAPGGDPDLIIICSSHLDSVASTPGASDNASGVAMNMALAKYFFDKDLGNIEVRFIVGGSEEGNSNSGARFIISSLTQKEKEKAFDYCLDMVATPGWFTGSSWGAAGLAVDSLSVHYNRSYSYPQGLLPENRLDLTMSASLFTNYVDRLGPLPTGIVNVKLYNNTGSDMDIMQQSGLEAAGIIYAANYDDGLEYAYHTAMDTLDDNYSFERIDFIYRATKNAILIAAEKQISKRARLAFNNDGDKITLLNTNLFNIFDKVEVILGGTKYLNSILVGVGVRDDRITGGTKLTFEKDGPTTLSVPLAAQGRAITSVVGFGEGVSNYTGIPNNMAAAVAGHLRSAPYKNPFRTELVPLTSIAHIVSFYVDDEISTAIVNDGEKALRPADPEKAGYRFDGWFTEAVGGAIWDFDTAITADLQLFAHWTKYTYTVYLKTDQTEVGIDDILYVDVMLTGDINYTQLATEIAYDTGLLEFAGYEDLQGWAAGVTTPASGIVAVRSIPTMNMIVGAPCSSVISIVTLKFKVADGFTEAYVETDLTFASAIVSPPGGITGTAITPVEPVTITLHQQ
jgi:uncharacterized repeat protein (TIGR02543 family)